MNENNMNRRDVIAAAGVLGCLGLVGSQAAALDNGAKTEADFFLPNDGPLKFELRGKDRPFGRYTCFGEMVDVESGDALGLLTDQDGDQIVGEVKLASDRKNKGHFHFRWRSSVTLSDGRTYVNTGKFSDRPPAGLVVIAIIAVLIALLLPAVQKVR